MDLYKWPKCVQIVMILSSPVSCVCVCVICTRSFGHRGCVHTLCMFDLCLCDDLLSIALARNSDMPFDIRNICKTDQENRLFREQIFV